jgi:hypothetical protein
MLFRLSHPEGSIVNEVVYSLPEKAILNPEVRFLDPAMGGGQFLRGILDRAISLGMGREDILPRLYGIERSIVYVNHAKWKLGLDGSNFKVSSCYDSGVFEVEFDYVVGNPPYGKNASLAVKFLNKSFELAPTVSFVLPKTFRKPSILNRIHPNLHLVEDADISDDTFGGTILTCQQRWERRDSRREKIVTHTSHPDFHFVTKSEANLFVGRVGAAAGRVKTSGFDHYTEQHYFLRASDTLKELLAEVEEDLREKALLTVGTPSLSKHDLIGSFLEKFG